MGVKITGTLLTPIKVELQHESGTKLYTMAPKDNGGDGSLFSPTDLCAASLASCVVTIMGLYAKSSSIHLDKITFDIEKEMSSSPRRIKKLSGTFKMYTNCSEADFEKIVRAGKACPIKQSLHPEIELDLIFERA